MDNSPHYVLNPQLTREVLRVWPGLKDRPFFIMTYIDEQRKALGAIIRDRRNAKGLTQQQFAAMIDTDQRAIWKLESGRWDYGINLFIKACNCLDINLEKLVHETP